MRYLAGPPVGWHRADTRMTKGECELRLVSGVRCVRVPDIGTANYWIEESKNDVDSEDEKLVERAVKSTENRKKRRN